MRCYRLSYSPRLSYKGIPTGLLPALLTAKVVSLHPYLCADIVLRERGCNPLYRTRRVCTTTIGLSIDIGWQKQMTSDAATVSATLGDATVLRHVAKSFPRAGMAKAAVRESEAQCCDSSMYKCAGRFHSECLVGTARCI